MDYNKIQDLVVEYINTTSKKERSSSFISILKEFEPLIQNFVNSLPEHPRTIREDALSFYQLNLLEAIERYKTSNAKFSTFWYYISKHLKKDFYRETNSVINHDKAQRYRLIEKYFVTSESETDNLTITDMTIDLSKILTKEETLIMNAYISGTIKKYVPLAQPIIEKLTTYIRT